MNQQCTNLGLIDHIDDLISKEFIHLSEDEIQTKCNEIAQSYQSLTDKKAFDDSYVCAFLKRISTKRDECLKYEEMIILKIREINPTFLPVFDDVKASLNGSNQKIHDYLQDHNKEETLNADFEPIISETNKVRLPFYYANESPLTNACIPFMSFIKEGNNSLVSNIINDYSNCDLELEFPNGKKYIITSDFNVSSIILAIAQKSQTFDDICKLCKDEKYAFKIIKKLYEIKLIKRFGVGRNVKKFDFFRINHDFSSEKEHIIIPLIKNPKNRHYGHVMYERKEMIKYAIVSLLKRADKPLEITEIEKRIKEKFESLFDATNEMIYEKLSEIENINARKNTVNEIETWEFLA